MQETEPGGSSDNTSLPANLRMRNTEGIRFQKLLKEELRMTIMTKRRARGEEEVKVEFPEPEAHELTVAELERRERRREQNRRAAQRCRRKKRMNQMSVLRNYEWIITHNQQLQQEVEQLRQKIRDLHSVLKTHQDACTCSLGPKALLPAMAAVKPKVKVEPGDAVSSPQAAATPSGPSSCHFGSAGNGDELANCSIAEVPPPPPPPPPPQQQQQGFNSVQGRGGGYPALSYGGTGFAPSPVTSGVGYPMDPSGRAGFSADLNSGQHTHPMMGEPAAVMGGSLHGHGLHAGGYPAMPAPYSSPQQHVQAPLTPGGHVSLLEELSYLPRGLRPCAFQEEAATPLSSDGRRSISSVSSDVSAASEPHCRDVPMTASSGQGLGVGELYASDDGAPGDVSHLLSQINQSDLIFQADGSLDEVFSGDPVAAMGAMPDHFLHHIQSL